MGWHWKCQPSEKIVDFRDGEEGEFPSRENTVFEMARRESSRAGKILTNIDRIKEIRDGR